MIDEQLDPASFPIKLVVDVVKARQHGLEMALAMGFSQLAATQIATVVSELARNIIIHAGGKGAITLLAANNVHAGGKKMGLKVIAQDQGPGIEDVELALAGGLYPCTINANRRPTRSEDKRLSAPPLPSA
jgi:serine/threonine-protein kinase RsbT